ncbi:MAG: tyrosine-type recombinase/integrase [Pelodictyon phaeoclathratiforme]
MARHYFAILSVSYCCDVSKHAGCCSLAVNRIDIRTVQELLGHNDVRTTMIYTHVLSRGPSGVRRSVDGL